MLLLKNFISPEIHQNLINISKDLHHGFYGFHNDYRTSPQKSGSLSPLSVVISGHSLEHHQKMLEALQPLTASLQEVLMSLIPDDQQMLYNFILPEFISWVIGEFTKFGVLLIVGTTVEFVKCQPTSKIRAMHRHFDKKNSRGIKSKD